MSDAAPVVSVSGLSKQFCRDLKRSLYYGLTDIAGEVTAARERSPDLRPGEFWALRDVDLELRPREALGIVGPNGAGKTTLLRLVSGLIKPDRGHITVRGRVAPLLALGAGFNPVLTGRENVFVNMSILGLAAREIARRFDAVVEFAEVADALDAPVQTYSAGMAARLGFACAVHTDPDIVLVDEVLAVGDMGFQDKCYRRLKALRDAGAAFILVSHHPQVTMEICDRAVYLLEGAVAAEGDVDRVMRRYEEDLLLGRHPRSPAPGARPDPGATGIVGVDLLGGRGARPGEARTGEPLSLRFRVRGEAPLGEAGLTVWIFERHGSGGPTLVLSSFNDGATLRLAGAEAVIELALPELGLPPGHYSVSASLRRPGLDPLDSMEAVPLVVRGGRRFLGRSRYHQPRTWTVR